MDMLKLCAYIQVCWARNAKEGPIRKLYVDQL